MPGTIALRNAPPEAGAKAFNLGRLLRAGFPVPEGLCVLGQLEGAVEGLAAVRSSSASEDGRYGAAAGQFLTLLNVSPEGLSEAVERVFAGLTGSVIVQPMVKARVAGVVFTRDPTCASPCMRVEAAPGLGDSLVSGHVRPSAWRGRELLEGLPCLNPAELESLERLAESARELLGGELDLEFAFAEGPEPWLLQARPITASQDLREELRAREVERCAALGETVWSGYNVAETLPAPLPMSWSVVRRMMSLEGAYGRLYPELGYDPDPSVESVVDLICGRPYLNLNRSARLLFQGFPFVFRLADFRADPRKAAFPQPRVDLSRAAPGFWRKLPGTVLRMLRGQRTLDREKAAFPQHFRERVLPDYLRRLRELPADPRARFEGLLTLVVDEFAGQSLKASAFAALALAGHGKRPVPAVETEGAGLLRRAAAGELSFEALLEGMGHRGPAEMELAEPRWREVPERLRAEVAKAAAGPHGGECSQQNVEPGALARWLALRETARHHLMLGWGEMRRALLELDAARGLNGGIFWLHYDELDLANPHELIARRRLERRLLLSLPCPVVLFSDDLEAIGRPLPVAASADVVQGTPLSWGTAEGPALVVRHPSEVPSDATGYVLVCPSTDPGYTLAMARAVALVVETGGVLSHGAIVAREFGLPAVSNVPMGVLAPGSRVRVDGAAGSVCAVPPPG